VAYSITATDLENIYDHELKITTRDQEDATIRILPKGGGWPRAGAEAIGLKTKFEIRRSTRGLQIESMQAFLKIFKSDVPQRAERIRLLIARELAKKHEAFHGIPFGWLGKFNINGVELIGHFTRMIPGPYNGGPEDFGRLRGSGQGPHRWATFTEGDRKRFGGELASAVAGLETCGIIHGDISPGNLLIGQSNLTKEHMCILCDYDGYYSPQVPLLPRKNGRTPCRPLGSPGYQYPALRAAMLADKAGDANIWVQTDRFALSIAICEMMIWSDSVEAYLEVEGRDHLLGDEMITARDAGRLPRNILDSFPDGFEMLDRALKANSPSSMPSPEDWLRVLGFDEPPVAFTGRPDVIVFRRQGNSRQKMTTVHLTKLTGNFGPAVSQLKALSYRFTNKLLTFDAPKTMKVSRRRNGRLTDVQTGFRPIIANPGDIFYFGLGTLELEIVDRPLQLHPHSAAT
jgi:hypothetical protein